MQPLIRQSEAFPTGAQNGTANEIDLYARMSGDLLSA